MHYTGESLLSSSGCVVLVNVNCSGGDADHMIAVEDTLVVPDRPCDAHDLVRERDCCLMRVRSIGTPQRPLLELREWLVPGFQTSCAIQRCTGVVDERADKRHPAC